MIRYLVAAAAVIASPLAAQTTAPGAVGSATVPYAPAGAASAAGARPGTVGPAGVATVPALPQPATGVTPPVGTTGDGRVGTLAPGGATTPAVTGQAGMQTTTGVSPTTPTTNPPPR